MNKSFTVNGHLIERKESCAGDWCGTDIKFYLNGQFMNSFNDLSDNYALTNASEYEARLIKIASQKPTNEEQ